MRYKYRDRLKNKALQAGFTLIELMIAMVISLTLVFACTALYSSLKNSIQIAQGLATAQESLRSSFYLMSRSVRQAGDITISGTSDAVLTVTYDEPPASSAVYTCLGNTVSAEGDTDIYSVEDPDNDGDFNLYCADHIDKQLIALAVTELHFVAISDASGTVSGASGTEVTMEIEGIPPSYGDEDGDDIGEITFTLALRQKILSEL